MKTALVTGATGFLGGHLVQQLLDAGWRVRALYRSPASMGVLSALEVDACQGDVTDRGSLERALQDGVDVVFHAAASTASWKPHFPEQRRINVEGTANVVEVCLAGGAKRLVHTSSVVVYGLTDEVIDERSAQAGLHSWIHYARTKAEGETVVRAGIARGLDAVICNPTHILGPGDTRNWARLIMLVDQRKLPGSPPGSGAFIDVRAAAAAEIAAAERGRCGENYLLGGEDASFLDLIQRIGRLLDRPTPKRALPAAAMRAYARMLDWTSRLTGREPDATPESVAFVCQRMRCDIRKARSELGLEVTPLDELLVDTVRWLRQQRLVSAQ
ncbi:MAG: NAD-dependent epimerase/dehydratase family protein [Xanthomonadales bacterium]|nr:NAD-dependent epimerase/dehydratase family protein [Xanthomonadales bacterium]